MWPQHYDIQTDIQTDRQTYIHTDRQTEPKYDIDDAIVTFARFSKENRDLAFYKIKGENSIYIRFEGFELF